MDPETASLKRQAKMLMDATWGETPVEWAAEDQPYALGSLVWYEGNAFRLVKEWKHEREWKKP